MKIKQITHSHRNDFRAIFVCPRCGHEYEAHGYCDNYFYDTVMPNAICSECRMNEHGENENELKARLGRTFEIK